MAEMLIRLVNRDIGVSPFSTVPTSMGSRAESCGDDGVSAVGEKAGESASFRV